MPPSSMIKLTEGCGEHKNDFEGEDNGFQKEEGKGVGRAKIRLPANIVCLQNPFTGWTGALIGAVGSTLITICQSETCPFTAVRERKEIWRTCKASIVLSKKLFHLSLGISLELRPEQKQAIYTLLSRPDLLAVLPTGFGKSLIFQFLVQVKEILLGKTACVIVVCPLKSIVPDQMTEASSMGLTAVSLSEASLQDVESGKHQLIFVSAEEILKKSSLDRLKKSSTLLHQNFAALIVDKSHTVETWTSQRFVFLLLCFSLKNRILYIYNH